MPRPSRIAIIGGGIGGLAAALALERRGAEVVVRAVGRAERDRRRAQSHAERGQGVARARPRTGRPGDRGRNRFSQHPQLEERPLHFAHQARRFPPKIRRAESFRAPRRPARSLGGGAQDNAAPLRRPLRRRRRRRAFRHGYALPTAARSRPMSWSVPTAFIRRCAKACSAPTSRASPAASAGAAWCRSRPCRPTSIPRTAPCGWVRTAMSCITRCAAANCSTSSPMSTATPGPRNPGRGNATWPKS